MNEQEQNQNIQTNDDVILELIEDTILEIYEGQDVEMDVPVEELWNKGQLIECTVCDITPGFYGVQLGDGSFTFINKTSVVIKQVN
jgi:hypothetical protein